MLIKQKIITKPKKKKEKNDHENVSKRRKKNMATIEIKSMSDASREIREYMKNHYYNRKNLLNHLISCVEE